MEPDHVESQVAVLSRAALTAAAARRFAAVDAVPWPVAVAAEPDETPVRRAASWAQDEPWQADERLREALPDESLREEETWREHETWRGARLVGRQQRAARPFSSPGQTSPRSPRSQRRQEEMLQNGRRAEA
ncbi:hypothetical protein V1291_002462 [Nitrobacteraceae bacterium AZCC 1564]